MSLGIYTAPNTGSQLSSGTFSNPLRISLDSKEADFIEMKLYVRSDNTSTYNSIVVRPVVIAGGRDVVNGVDGYSWKLRAGTVQPLSDEWETITPGVSISLPDTSSNNTYLPFWLRVEIPFGATVDSYQNVVLRITANEVM